MSILRDLGKVSKVDAIILAVAHRRDRDIPLKRLARLCDRGTKVPLLIDVKAFYFPDEAHRAGFRYWRL